MPRRIQNPLDYPAWQRLGLIAVITTAVLGTLIATRPTTLDATQYRPAATALLANLAARNAKEFEFTPEDFPFNPNTVSKADLLRLGVADRRADSWLKYRGNRTTTFKKPGDIGKLYGLDDALKARLISLAVIPTTGSSPRNQPAESFPFDPNTVDKDDLMRLGLQAYQAKAYLNYRAKIEDGFTRPRQLERLKFLDDQQRQNLLSNADFPEPAPLTLKANFTFDPNLISADSLELLGFPAYQARSLVRYRGDRRVTFRKPEDLRRVNSLDSILLGLVIPLARIDLPTDYAPAAAPRKYQEKILPALASIDLNTADTALLQTLPGIGSYRAQRFVRYREALGGFLTLEQASGTRGIPDSTWQKVLPYLELGPIYRQLNVNEATVEALKSHPAINSKLANAVVRFREKHGPYLSEADLRQIRLFSDKNLPKILPYLTFE